MPSAQLDLPSATVALTRTTVRKRTIDSSGSKRRDNGLLIVVRYRNFADIARKTYPAHHARSVMTGMTNRAIWMLEPTATPMERSNLSL